MCAFSLVVENDLLKDTDTDGVKSTSDHQQQQSRDSASSRVVPFVLYTL